MLTPHTISIAAGIVFFCLSLDHSQPAAPKQPDRGPDPWPRVPELAEGSYRDDTSEATQ